MCLFNVNALLKDIGQSAHFTFGSLMLVSSSVSSSISVLTGRIDVPEEDGLEVETCFWMAFWIWRFLDLGTIRLPPSREQVREIPR